MAIGYATKILMVKLAFLILLLFAIGCEKAPTTADVTQLMEQLEDVLNNSELSKLTAEEIEKLFVFEYTVIEWNSNLSAESEQKKLEELGKERWECFHIETQKNQKKAYCKRRPRSYLRYLPRMF